MKCPECGKATIAYNSREVKDNKRWRRRECKSCGNKFTTIESTDAITPKIKEFTTTGQLAEFIRDRDGEVTIQSILVVYTEAYYRSHKKLLNIVKKADMVTKAEKTIKQQKQWRDAKRKQAKKRRDKKKSDAPKDPEVEAIMRTIKSRKECKMSPENLKKNKKYHSKRVELGISRKKESDKTYESPDEG